MNPVPKPLIGTGEWNTRLLYDLLGQRVESREMGPVPNVPPEAAGLIVTITNDVVSTIDNETSLREAAACAMASNKIVVFDSKLVGGKEMVFPLKNQIVVPSGKTLRISANLGEVTLKPEAGCSNRFFRVERGGRLELKGIIMDGGYAKGDYEVGKRPADDDDGGAICSEGELVLTGCTVLNCSANGYGGAVWSSGGMTATGCTFADNSAQRGGGVCSSDEKLRLSGVSITGNTALDYGGGLYLVTGSNDVLATGMTITGNTASGKTVLAGPNCGGGVYLTANMSAHPGTVTISGTVANNIGGDDSRDGGTEPVSPVQTSETPEKGGVPFTPTPRHMSAVNALAATPALVLPVCEVNGRAFDTVKNALEAAKPRDTVRLVGSTSSDDLAVGAFVTLDLNGFQLADCGAEVPRLPKVAADEGVLVAYRDVEAGALFDDGRFAGTMRFGEAVEWRAPDGEVITFAKGTDVTVGTESGKTDAYVVTTVLTNEYGFKDGWSVTVYGSAELGGSSYVNCSLEVLENVRVVKPLVLSGATLAVSGTVEFAEGAYIGFRDLSKGGVYAHNQIDLSHFCITDPVIAGQVGVVCTELGDGTFWYHLDESAQTLAAEVDYRCYTLRDAFAVANGNGHTVTLLRDDADDAGTIAVERSIAFDMNGHRICGAGGTNLTFAVSGGTFAVFGCGSAGCTDVTFQLGRGAAGDGALALSGGSFTVTNGPVLAVDAACTAAVLALTNGVKLLAPAAVSEIVRLDGFADCLIDNATVRGDSATNAIVHHAARIVVTNGATLVSKGVTIRQTASSACSRYDFSLEVSGEDSLIHSCEGPHCVASELTSAAVGTKSVTNRFTCVSGDFECPKADSNAAVVFVGGLEYEVTGGRFGGSVAPLVSPKCQTAEIVIPGRELYWQIGSLPWISESEGSIAYDPTTRTVRLKPNQGVTEVEINNMPADAEAVVPPTVRKVIGVADEQIKVGFGNYDITDAFKIEVGAIELNPDGRVGAVKVTPMIGDLPPANGSKGGGTEPFAVGEGRTAVTIMTIPGLKYELRRAKTLPAPRSEGAAGTVWSELVAVVVADGTTVTLEDGDPPANKAFYWVVVSVP